MRKIMAKRKDNECGRYNVDAVMSRIPDLMGMELVWRKDAWEGRYYLNGDRHPYKRDKLKVKVWAGNGVRSIWVHEQGGMSLSLPNWLQQYGGANNYQHALAIIFRNERPTIDMGRYRAKSEREVCYVPHEVFEQYKAYELERSNLFMWLCRLFGESRVRAVFERYNVTSDGQGNTIYWYMDAEGRIAHDKVMRYKANGKCAPKNTLLE